MPLEFVNVEGARITDAQIKARKQSARTDASRRKKTADDKSFHKGWRVTGIPPGALDAARAARIRLCEMAAKAGGKQIKPFDEAAWLQKHKGKAVRAKPYELEQAARDCAALAAKAGWLRVQINEVKRDVRKSSSAAC